MSGRRVKLDRWSKTEFTINANQKDVFRFWSTSGSLEHEDKPNLSLDAGGDSILTIYGIRREQLAQLYAEIGDLLGMPSSVTVQHLKELKAHLEELLPSPTPFDQFNEGSTFSDVQE